MANSLGFRQTGLALFAVITFLSPAVRGKDFVSKPYGFQISLPAGYREQRADGANLIAQFVEPQSERGGPLITIDLRHTAANYDPADKAAVSNLLSQKGSTSSVETRRWKDLELQIMRQEIAASPNGMNVSFATLFPLVDNGIIVLVEGEKSREKEVARIFDTCLRQFVNSKPYATAAEKESSILQMLPNVLLPVIIGAIVIFWVAKLRKARSQSGVVAEPDN